jgi:hypothetical protein
MQTKRTNPATALPADILRGSAVARLLWARRGTRDGWRLDELAARLRSTQPIMERRLAVLAGLLARLPWGLEFWSERDQIGELVKSVTLVGPGCPRPPARILRDLDDNGPELISLSELAALEEMELP